MLTQNGAPSQLESFDYKPKLRDMFGQELPDSVRAGQRLTGMTAKQTSLPLVGSKFDFKQYGKSGAYISDLFPNIAKITDDLCIIKSMHTDAINHDPALTFLQTGAQVGNRPSMGSWLSYGLGSENQNLPAFTVLLSKGKGNGQGVYSKLWGNGFLDSTHQGVQLSASEDPILYLNNPKGIDSESRRKMLNHLGKLNEMGFDEFGDPEIKAKIKQYEMAFRMQTAVPEITDVSSEPDQIKKVPRLGAKAYQQSVAFLRIKDAVNPLDNSAVHPESYSIVKRMSKDSKTKLEDFIGNKEILKGIHLENYCTDTVGIPTLKDIISELEKPGLDPRKKVKLFEFNANIKTIDDLKVGQILPGIVNNVTNFGCFVNIGIKESGLVHISKLKKGYVGNVSDVVHLNQHVQVKVEEVDIARKRIQLAMNFD